MTAPKLVEVPAHGVTTEVTMPIQHLCPFVDEVDTGHATMAWDVDGQTVELHSLRDWLATLSDQRVSHEWLTGMLYEVLATDLGLDGVAVTTTWTTAGGAVKVTA